MKSTHNSIKSILIATMLFISLGVFNSCQNNEDEIIFAQEIIHFTKNQNKLNS